jgi:dUTP pyrophosphatase
MLVAPKITLIKTDEDADLPKRTSVSDTGYILKAIETKIIPDQGSAIVDTGLKVENMVKGVWALILPITKLNIESNIIAGTQLLDNTFKGELKIKLYNHSTNGYLINKGDDIAQIAYFPLLTIEPEWKTDEQSL